jgi:cytochrome c553
MCLVLPNTLVKTSPAAMFERCYSRIWIVLVALMTGLLPRIAGAAEGRTGEQIFRQLCARCHGQAGEGTQENYPHPLVGKRSLAQLTRTIAKTMPKDDPGKCVGPDAEKVAAYIYQTFYSKDAQARNKPPRLELTRLTVRQYRNAVADLIGSFRAPGHWDGQHGLRGEYFKSRRFRNGERVLERVDPTVHFDFGTASPLPEKIQADQFSIRWQGSVLAPETGTYEFIVRTEHATRLWVNDLDRPLIDALVKSINDTEHHASIFLLGGRVYPLRLEFSKAKQGVDDSKTRKTKPPEVKAAISLEWKLPQQAAEAIPERNLSPQTFPEMFVLTTPFPPDDRSVGYERGTSISEAWERATTDAAIEIADHVVRHLRELAGAGDKAPDREQHLREFCQRFAERAFRRPLTAQQKLLYIDHMFKSRRDLDTAVKRAVLLVLQSPWFLYREISGGRDAYDVASRLSFGLWDSLPDKELLEAAAKGRLATLPDVRNQAERMVPDLRTHAKLRTFLLQWLKVDQPPDLAKDTKRFPGFDGVITSDLRTSLDLFLEDVLWSEASDFRQLLLADYLYLNGRLARFYGAGLAGDASFQKVVLQPRERAGVLTHPYLTAAFAYTGESSPIHRGVFLARSVLGRTLRPPPEAFTPLPADLHPDLTTRERVALQTKPEACLACHGMINPLGFTLENFDAVGRYRKEENGRPIDATGAYLTRNGEIVKFADIRDLATFLAGSEETHEAFIEQLFHYLIKQPIRAFGPRKLSDLRQFFARNQYNVRKLLMEIAATSALAQKRGQDPFWPLQPGMEDRRAGAKKVPDPFFVP